MRRILVIEDDDGLRAELLEMIEALGGCALGARSSADALAVLCAAPHSVNVILCDLRLKAESGLDALRALRAAGAKGTTEPTMYLMTGHLDLTAAARSEIAALTHGSFVKPISIATIRALATGTGADGPADR